MTHQQARVQIVCWAFIVLVSAWHAVRDYSTGVRYLNVANAVVFAGIVGWKVWQYRQRYPGTR
jgi:hypothetical protein